MRNTNLKLFNNQVIIDRILDSSFNYWSLPLIRMLEWHTFEELCCFIIKSGGYETEHSSIGPDGGIDIKIFKTSNGKQIYCGIAQCKAYCKQKIQEKQAREFLGVLMNEKLSRGFYFTASSFSEKAYNLLKNNGVIPYDGHGILKLINKIPEEKGKLYLTQLTTKDFITPVCINCKIKMTLRQNNKKGTDFWGCTNFPKCSNHYEVKDYIEILINNPD
ncbi:MAG: restriction endonuclease [Desulfobulbaceae bacterium]|nr:restriction endonuclease [Desulfobulbaceae bacterium]